MLEEKLTQIEQIFSQMSKAIVAFSGGVDSALVCYLAYKILGDSAIAITAASPSLLQEELEEAKNQAKLIGIKHEVIETQEMQNPNYSSNPVNRCYFCKSELHDHLKEIAQERGYPYVVDGVNLDDLSDYRPGVQAARERGVRSPLAEVGMSKFQVRELSQKLGLPWWDKPASPCLSSRFPYGEQITQAKLERVGKAEIYLRSLGYRNVRVRSQDDVARIELPAEAIKDFINKEDIAALSSKFHSFGFVYITLDLEGYRSGKLNQMLNLQTMKNFG
jgi:pyridinium-3,5-biscarboxylic acid mononucleotide sulfurtransferase